MTDELKRVLCIMAVGIAAVGILLVLVARLAVFVSYMSREAMYLKAEIRRADSHGERRYWENELRALYLSMIPGISRERAARIAHRRKK